MFSVSGDLVQIPGSVPKKADTATGGIGFVLALLLPLSLSSSTSTHYPVVSNSKPLQQSRHKQSIQRRTWLIIGEHPARCLRSSKPKASSPLLQVFLLNHSSLSVSLPRGHIVALSSTTLTLTTYAFYTYLPHSSPKPCCRRRRRRQRLQLYLSLNYAPTIYPLAPLIHLFINAFIGKSPPIINSSVRHPLLPQLLALTNTCLPCSIKCTTL